MKKTSREMRQDRAKLLDQAQALIDGADGANRDLSAEERSQVDGLMTQAAAMLPDIEQREQLEGLRGELREQTATAASPFLGMSDREIQAYSLVRAIDAQAEYMRGNHRAMDAAGLEMEASRAMAKLLGREPRGFFVPFDVQVGGGEKRAVEKGGTASGAQLVATDKLVDSFIELLRNKMMCRAAGATILGGLVGDISIPRQSAGGTAGWVAEGIAGAASNLTVGQLALSPKTLTAFTDYTRKMLKQSSVDVEMLVRNDLAQVVAIALDLAGLAGSGAANQPTGIAATSGINMVYAGGAPLNTTNVNGAAPVWADIVNLEQGVAVSNADVGRLAYMFNPKTRGKFKQTQIAANLPMIWGANDQGVNGYNAFVTSQVPATLTKGTSAGICSAGYFGNWAELIFALWGALDVLTDPFTGSNTGTVRVNVFQDADVGVRHAGSFSYVADMLAG